jgi:hypothetical protein
MTNYHDPSDKSKPQEIYKVWYTPNPDGSVNVEKVTNKDND